MATCHHGKYLNRKLRTEFIYDTDVTDFSIFNLSRQTTSWVISGSTCLLISCPSKTVQMVGLLFQKLPPLFFDTVSTESKLNSGPRTQPPVSSYLFGFTRRIERKCGPIYFLFFANTIYLSLAPCHTHSRQNANPLSDPQCTGIRLQTTSLTSCLYND